MTKAKPFWPPILAAAILCVVVYGPRLGVPLIWDDYGTIVLNRALDKPIPLKHFFTHGFRSRPLTTRILTLFLLSLIRQSRASFAEKFLAVKLFLFLS